MPAQAGLNETFLCGPLPALDRISASDQDQEVQHETHRIRRIGVVYSRNGIAGVVAATATNPTAQQAAAE